MFRAKKNNLIKKKIFLKPISNLIVENNLSATAAKQIQLPIKICCLCLCRMMPSLRLVMTVAVWGAATRRLNSFSHMDKSWVRVRRSSIDLQYCIWPSNQTLKKRHNDSSFVLSLQMALGCDWRSPDENLRESRSSRTSGHGGRRSLCDSQCKYCKIKQQSRKVTREIC